MDKKRAIIIAVILFLLIGLGSFVFAGSSNELSENKNSENINQEEDKGNQTDEDDSSTEGEGGKESTTVSKVDNSYTKALEAVVKAEENLTLEDIENAKELIDKVTNGKDTTELVNRVETIENLLEVAALVQELASKTDSAKVLTDLTVAREFRTTELIVESVKELSDKVNETLKDDVTKLVEELTRLAIILDDTTAPVVEGVKDKDITNEVNATVKEENLTILLNDKEVEAKDLVAISEEGNYTLKVIDKAFNETIITFTIDTTLPTAEVEYSTDEIINGDVTVTLMNSSENISIINNNGLEKYTFTENGTFEFEIVDVAGNTNKITATVTNIDKVNPVIEKVSGTEVSAGKLTKAQNVIFAITEENLDNVYYSWVTSNNNYNATNLLDSSFITDNGDGTYTISIATDFEGSRKLNVKVVDKAENFATYRSSGWYRIDSTAPTAEVVYSTDAITNGEVVATLINPSEEVTITNNDGLNEYTFTENGTFTFTFVDYAGNEGSVTATVTNIDKVNPVIKKVSGKESGSGYATKPQNVVFTITEENLDKVYYSWVNSNNNTNATNLLDSSFITDNGDGTYTISIATDFEGSRKLNVKVVDKAGNFATYRSSGWYRIDSTAPTAEVEYSIDVITNGEVVATIINPSENITITNNDGLNEYTFTENGTFTFTFVDYAGNEGSVTATVTNIDKVNPIIEKVSGTEVSAGKVTKAQNVIFAITEENLDKVYYSWVTGNNNTNASNLLDSSFITDNGDGTYTVSIATDFEGSRKLNVKVVDKAGNFATYRSGGWYRIDSVNPLINNVPADGEIVSHSVSPMISDANLESVTLTKNGNEVLGYQDNMYELSHDGVYVISAKDLAGNTTSTTFTIASIPTTALDLKEAIANANDGDIVYVPNGTYNVGHLSIDKAITLKGESKNVVIEVNEGGLEGAAGIYVSAAAILENFKVVQTNTAYAGIKVSTPTNPLTPVSKVTIRNVEVDGGRSGINIHGVTNATIDKVTVTNSDKIGLSVASSNVTVTNSNISAAAWGSIRIMYKLNDTTYPATSNVTIGSGNTIPGYISAEYPEEGNGYTLINPSEWTDLGNQVYSQN